MSYDATSITVLEGLDAVRKRPGMYIGSTGERGLHHLVTEVVDNAVDEALAGYCDRIEIDLLADGGVRVKDNGRGIPVDEVASEGRPALEVVLTTLHAGGKFGGDGYKVSGGLHGVGISVVNALSERLAVEVRLDGTRYFQEYVVGNPVAPLAQRGHQHRDRHDRHVLAERGHLRDHALRLRDARQPVPRDGVPEQGPHPRAPRRAPRGQLDAMDGDLDLDVDRGGPGGRRRRVRTVTYMFEHGLVDYVTHLNRGKPAIHRTIIGFEADSTDAEGQAMSLEMALQWNAQFSESVHTFANTINTHEGGTHEEGFRAALTTLVNRFAREWNILKEKDANLSGDDVREGLTAIVSLKLAEPQFEGQTKTKLGNTEAKSFVQKLVNEQLGMWFEQNPTEGKEIARKAQSASIARLAARKARDAARSRKGLMGGGGLPGKLADCQSTEPAECELFIVEGDSAGGPAKAGPRLRGCRRSCRSAARS